MTNEQHIQVNKALLEVIKEYATMPKEEPIPKTKARYHGIGRIIKTHEGQLPTKVQCMGCYNEGYHYGLGGQHECWSFKNALTVDVRAHPDIHATETQIYEKSLSCYRGVNKGEDE